MTGSVAQPRAPSLQTRFRQALFALSRRIPLAGFDARALLPEEDECTQIVQALGAAVALLERYAPVRLECLKRDLPRIWVGLTHNRGECLAAVSMCLLRFDYVANPSTSPVSLAMTLVHEGTHARLIRAGFGYRESQRRRLEHLCVWAELIFAKRVPGSEHERESVGRLLEENDEFWSSAASQQRALNHLRTLGWSGKVGFHIAKVGFHMARLGIVAKRLFTGRAA